MRECIYILYVYIYIKNVQNCMHPRTPSTKTTTENESLLVSFCFRFCIYANVAHADFIGDSFRSFLVCPARFVLTPSIYTYTIYINVIIFTLYSASIHLADGCACTTQMIKLCAKQIEQLLHNRPIKL